MRTPRKFFFALTLAGILLGGVSLYTSGTGRAASQAGRRTAPASERGSLVNVFAARADSSSGPVTARDIALFDGGVEQKIQGFSPDPGPARIVLLVDNSLSLRSDVEKLAQTTREFAYEIYEGDQVMVIGYDENAEIIADWTDDAKKIEAALPSFRKRGEPHLFDALSAVIDQALGPLGAGTRKRVIVLVADGLDRGSKTRFKAALSELQMQDITVYSLQIPDRTGGALRRDKPKPAQVIQQLVEGTGGRILSVTEPREAAKSICDELRKNRYVLSYTPSYTSIFDTRRILIAANDGINVRSKLMQPAR
ncbi:MAG: VWA domain-containing protein [Pyrinomonadaceae bacterium]|nr:VWA domain-containing protein [Pyrinomonadaceae bacterium]